MVDVYGRAAAERIYGAELVQHALRLAIGSRSSLMSLGYAEEGMIAAFRCC
ncbi:hypothetical protein [Streptomyces sp. TLI_146]|uniref:hypothetical protein n=1 Tax=Streptomyces sp. TLI_146 TaxID=1938858 RepID=UPI0015D5FFC0|nr:hypothetical protein [Streptomyces sp. TLI_146]